MQTYQPGSDRKTAKLAAALVAKVRDAIEKERFGEAERLIAIGANAANIPFRIEFEAQSKA